MDLTKYLNEEWDLSNVPEEEREEYIAMIGELLYRSFNDDAVMLLNDNEKEQLETLLSLPGTDPMNVLNFYNEILTGDKVRDLLKKNLETLRAKIVSA